MEWRSCYLDMVLVPLGFLMSIAYHCWLWHKVRTQPLTTIIGTNASGRRFWVSAMMKDNDKKNILAVQTLRNTIMGSTLMATTSILLCAGLAVVISSTYSVKKPLNDSIFGAHGFISQVNILINTPQEPAFIVTPDYVSELLEKGFLLNTVGNRLFYAALPLLLWIFGPVLAFLCSVTMVPVLYNLDFVFAFRSGIKQQGKADQVLNGCRDCESV